MENNTKTIYCTICCKDLELKKFPPSRHFLNRSQCTVCTTNRSKLNPDRSEKQRRNKLLHRYKTTPEELKLIAEKQHYKCAICSSTKEKVSTKEGLVVDHCHKTGKIRGLLCHDCNILLGKAKDDLHILYMAAGYLLIHQKLK